MSFLQALSYFLREACLSLLRGFKVSLLAILTIAVSIFLGGVFLLVSLNLAELVAEWRSASKIVVYLENDLGREDVRPLVERLEVAPWTLAVTTIEANEARRRFREAFPSLEDLLEGWGEDPLPASLEVSVDPGRLDPVELDAWLAEMRALPAVSMIDDDRDWLAQLETVLVVIRGLGMVVGTVLLLTAIFTIASVIRLTTYLYHEEIAVMRLVGATEFFIRGPFYLEGLIQGLLGGTLAVTGLWGAHFLLVAERPDALLSSVLASEFLGALELLALVGLGGLAGLIGAVTSLRRESLGSTAEE